MPDEKEGGGRGRKWANHPFSSVANQRKKRGGEESQQCRRKKEGRNVSFTQITISSGVREG